MSKRTNICREGTRLRATHLPSGMHYDYRATREITFNHAVDEAINGLIADMHKCPHNSLEKYLVNKRDDSSLKAVRATKYHIVDAVPISTNVPNLYIASVIMGNRRSFGLHDLFVEILTEDETNEEEEAGT